ncbi:MAG: transposase [Desulfobacula sp.]|nr:transposase [Desulfobacula sp.]
MNTIQDIITAFGPEYLERFGARIPANHVKVMKDIRSCRTRDTGLIFYSCKKCGRIHSVFRSCGNRHCPACQNHKTRDWLKTQSERQVPGHHFMVTFTLPQQVRGVVRSNQRISYGAMFKASSGAIKKLSPDKKYIGGDLPGFFGILHTWGRQLPYHPHIHYIVPGGAFSKKDGKWHSSRQDYYLPEKVLAKIYKAKFLHQMKKAGLLNRISFEARKMDWKVNCQAIGTGFESVKYLAPYVFKVAISNTRIAKVENRIVSFRYKKVKSNRWRTCQLDVMEFIRRFLQHVLPTGFMKVRYYGFLHPSSSVSLEKIRISIETANGAKIVEVQITITKYVPSCPDCGGELEYLYSVLPYMIPPKQPG